MVASGNQRRTAGRAKSGRVELRVPQPHFRDPVKRGRRNNATEGAGNAVARVVGHDQEDVGCTFGRHHPRRPPRLGLFGAQVDHATKRQIGRRQNVAGNCAGAIRRPNGVPRGPKLPVEQLQDRLERSDRLAELAPHLLKCRFNGTDHLPKHIAQTLSLAPKVSQRSSGSRV